jgi:Cu/Ag efflux protein CusF
MIRLPNWLVVVLALALVALLVTPVLAAEAKGKIKSVDQDKKQFVLTDSNGKDWTFDMDENAKVKLNDKDVKLADIKEGSDATVTYEKQGDKLIAKEIRCEKK